MFSRARLLRFLPEVLAPSKTHATKYSVRSWVVAVRGSFLPVLRILKPVCTFSASFAVLAACTPSKQSSALSVKELSSLLKKADDLFNESRYEDVLKLLHPYRDDSLEEVCWRISRAAFTLSKSKTITKAEHTALIEESYVMAKLTLELNQNSARGHKWMCIALDAHSALQGFRNRCAMLVPVKEHMMRSLELDPTDATVIYMVGMWYFSIADLAWYKRSILQAIAGKPPAASYEEALAYFQQAEETSPNFYSLNLLMLGKCYLKLGDQDKAIVYLQRAFNYPVFTDDDHQAHQEASDLLKSLQKGA